VASQLAASRVVRSSIESVSQIEAQSIRTYDITTFSGLLSDASQAIRVKTATIQML
jgi:hypothetical protein